jgi:hypothetical protein
MTVTINENNMETIRQGARVKVHGWIMLKGLDSGCVYEVIDDNYKWKHLTAYKFKRVLKNGKLSKNTIAHTKENIHLSLRDGNTSTDLNWLEILN